MRPGTLVYVTTGAVCAGLGVGLIFQPGMLFGAVVLGAGSAMLIVAALRRIRILFLVAAALAAFSLGLLRTDMVLQQEASETLPRHIGNDAIIAGKVIEDPDRRETALRLVVAVESVNDVPTSGTLLAMVPRDEEVFYGDRVVIEGPLILPKSFETDTGRTFDYPGYLRAHGISAQMQRATLKNVRTEGVSVLGMLYSLKHAFEASIEKLYPEPDGSLEEGILLGEKHGIPQSLTNEFTRSGLVHVVVLSGYNIAVVSEGVFRALSFLPQTWGLGVGGAVMILFSLMTGAGAATIRALLMALVALLGRYLHRSTVALRALVLVATGMALWNPESLLHDSSFVLSVLATFGLITLSPWVEAKLPRFLKKYESVRSIAASTIAVQLFVLPALLYFSGVLSFLSVPANVLALPVVPMAMLLGFMAGLLGFISPLLGFFPAILSDILLKWMLLVSRTTAGIPLSSVTISAFSPWVLPVLYLPLTWVAVLLYLKHSKT